MSSPLEDIWEGKQHTTASAIRMLLDFCVTDPTGQVEPRTEVAWLKYEPWLPG